MNKKMDQSFNERKAERSFLTTYTIHMFCMFVGIVLMDTNRFVPFLVLQATSFFENSYDMVNLLNYIPCPY